jgi:hypothetical protein
MIAREVYKLLTHRRIVIGISYPQIVEYTVFFGKESSLK